MADVVNSIATSPQGRPNTYTTSPCTSSNALVSPSIVEAIDRIFPKSPSQLLAHPFSDNYTNKKAPADNMPHPQANNVASTLPCMVSAAHLTTDTTTTATAIFTGLTTSSGTKSPVMSSTPTNHLDLPSLPAQAKFNQDSYHKNGTIDMSLKNSDVQKDLPQAKRISRADLEIMNNLSNDQIMKNGRSGRLSMADKETGQSQSKDLSDSDDMCRPFVSLQKERKKKKRKHKSNEQRRESGTNSKCLLGSPSSPKISKFSLPAAAPGNSTEDEFCHQDKNDSALFSPLVNDHCSKVNGLTDNLRPSDKDKTSVCEDVSISNISPCDAVKKKKRSPTSRQKLPKSTRGKYHVSKDSRRIKKFFPPSFVVLKKIDQLLLQGVDFGHRIDFNLSPAERVQALTSLCVQNKIPCSSREKTIDEIFNYKSPMDDFVCNNSEDEFRIPQGRSLRKRRQDICYVEPTEDDLLEDISLSSRKKSSGQSKKDTTSKTDVTVESVSPPKSDCEVPKEVSRKKKGKKSKTNEQESIISLDSPSHSKTNNSTLPQSQPSSENSENLNSSTAPAAAASSKSNNIPGTNISAATTPNLVYVYPKTSVVIGASHTTTTVATSMSEPAGKKSSSASKSTRPGPASKTNRPQNIVVSKAPVTTLNLLPGSKNSSGAPLPTGLSGVPLPASAFPQYFPTLAGSLSNPAAKNLPSNLCMVKIDGKDYLLSMPGSNSLLTQTGSSLNSTSTPAIPLSQPSLVSPGAPRYMLYQPTAGVMAGLRPTVLSQGSATTKSLTPSFTIPRLSTAVTLPGRPSSSTIHLLPTSLTSSTTLSSTSLFGSTQASVTNANVAVSTAKCTTSSTQANPLIPKPSTVVSLVTSAGSSSVSSQSVSTVITTTSGARQVRSLVTPLIAPGSATVIRHHPGQTSTTTSTVQLVAPNASVSGARCFRIIVPACSTTGSSARIATLGTSALTSPLTRLSASSTLLPQRKHSVDKEMSPEKRAAKRRRLEKKYPLPPGVVIKTEPLDTPRSSPSAQSAPVRSLLSGQNIQLIAASSRSGVGGVQRFRIISPTAPGVVVGSRPVRLGSNVIIRAPLIAPPTSRISSSSTVLTLATTSALSTASSLLSTFTSSAIVSSTVSQTTLTASSTTSTISASSSTGYRGNISLLSPSALLFSSTAALTSSVASACISTTSSTTLDTSLSISSSTTTKVSTQTSSVSSGSTDAASTSVANNTATPNLSSESQKDQSPVDSSISTETSGSSTAAVDIDNMKQSIKKLQTLIKVQEAQGLKGARLDKLKEILSQKENLLLQIEQQEEEMTRGDGNEVPVASIGVSADDPVIID